MKLSLSGDAFGLLIHTKILNLRKIFTNLNVIKNNKNISLDEVNIMQVKMFSILGDLIFIQNTVR